MFLTCSVPPLPQQTYVIVMFYHHGELPIFSELCVKLVLKMQLQVANGALAKIILPSTSVFCMCFCLFHASKLINSQAKGFVIFSSWV